MSAPVPHPSPFEKRPASWSRRLVGGWFARPHPAPIFLPGNQKSGTTAVGPLLAGLAGLPVTLDSHQRNPPAIPLLLNGSISIAKFFRMHRLEFSRPLIKDPNLRLCLHPLAKHFPQPRGNREVKWDDCFAPAILERIHSICRRNMLALQYPMQAPAPCLLP